MEEKEMVEKAGMEVLAKHTKENPGGFDQVAVTCIKVKCTIPLIAFENAIQKNYSLMDRHVEKEGEEFSLTGTLYDELTRGGIFNISFHRTGMSILPKYGKNQESGLTLMSGKSHAL